MATNKTQEQLRREAIANLAASRAEAGAEIQRLRQELNPQRVMHRMVDRHKAVLATVAAVGLASVFLIVRRTRQHPKRGFVRSHDERNVAQPGIGSQLVRVLAGSLVPLLLKPSVISPLLGSLLHPKSNGNNNPANTVSPQRPD